jgi:hypothetical protein
MNIALTYDLAQVISVHPSEGADYRLRTNCYFPAIHEFSQPHIAGHHCSVVKRILVRENNAAPSAGEERDCGERTMGWVRDRDVTWL